ncbi:Uncharacterised protein [uncultured archaeon]|nr:Uncharacterised protein [uncultured archaeon]
MYSCGGYSGTASYCAAGGGGYSSGYSAASCSNSYGGSSYGGKAEYAMPETPNFQMADVFLTEDRPMTPIVSELGEVRQIIEQTFEKITGQEFPAEDIQITICDETQFREMQPANGVVGFSFNRYGKGTSEIYAIQDHMDRLLLTIGHELGHILSPTLPNKQDEEAKAHAFSLAWMETIRDNNIGGLQPNISPNPAHNGLHDVAFDFVKYLLKTGASSFDVFKTLSHGLTSIIAEV